MSKDALAIIPKARVFVCKTPVNMSYSFDKLIDLVRGSMKNDVLSGDLFLFMNKNRSRLKLLFAAENGFVIFYKVLSGGSFKQITAPEISLLECKELVATAVQRTPLQLLTASKRA